MFAQQSDDPFLTLITLNHPDWSVPTYLVNNSEDVISNGLTFNPFPFKIVLPTDDGETARKIALELDNVSLDLITELRSVIDNSIEVKIEFILASNPDEVEFSFDELKISNINYNQERIIAELYLDDFLNTEIPSEKYVPTLYPGMFE